MVHQWTKHTPFTRKAKQSVSLRGEYYNARDEQHKPAFPVEYYADMSLNHKKIFMAAIIGNASDHLDLFQDLPCLDKDKAGQKLSMQQFNGQFRGDLACFFQAMFHTQEGSLLELDGSWEELGSGCNHQLYQKEHWHLQYSEHQQMRDEMTWLKCPGSKLAHRRHQKIEDEQQLLTRQNLKKIGTTTCCKVDETGKPVAMREARVVTWGQLFLLGAANGFTAQTVWAAGQSMKRIITCRERPSKTDVSLAADLFTRNERTQGGKWWGRGSR